MARRRRLLLSASLRRALPPGIETQGDVEDMLRLIAGAVLTFQTPVEFVGLVRMAMAIVPVISFTWVTARMISWMASAASRPAF